MDILICEDIIGPGRDALESKFDVSCQPDIWRNPERLREAARDVRALIVRNQTQVTAELIRAALRLEVIARAGAGLDNIDVDAATAAGIVVTYSPSENSISVAELTLGVMLSLARKIPFADRRTRGGGWDRRECTGCELSEKTLGIVGLGRIGRLVAARAQAFSMEIIAHDEAVDARAAGVRSRAELVPLDELLTRSDFVTCHLPLTDRTRGLFGEDLFRLMKPTAFFINTSRGEIVSETALVDVLATGQIAGAALDVREQEPPGPSPLHEMDNVVLTPHIAAFTHEAQARVVEAVCCDVAAVLRGADARNFANFPRPRRTITEPIR